MSTYLYESEHSVGVSDLTLTTPLLCRENGNAYNNYRDKII